MSEVVIVVIEVVIMEHYTEHHRDCQKVYKSTSKRGNDNYDNYDNLFP